MPMEIVRVRPGEMRLSETARIADIFINAAAVNISIFPSAAAAAAAAAPDRPSVRH